MLTRGKAQSAELPRRFYAKASSEPLGAGHGVMLDGRPVRTPAGARLELPTAALAALVAAEWQAQGERIAMADMPATRLAFTTVDAVAAARVALAEEVGRWAGADALCYFAEGPSSLVERELLQWGPTLDWAEETLGLALVRVTGLVHQPQPQATLDRARALALDLDDYALAGLAMAAGLFGSAVLALALHRGRLGGEAALELSRLDEAFQEEQWGVDAESAARTARMRSEAVMLGRWFQALA